MNNIMVKEPDYSNREIDQMFNEIMTILRRIEDQVTKTNGRVNDLEVWKETIMAKVTGVFATISIAWVIAKEFLFK